MKKTPSNSRRYYIHQNIEVKEKLCDNSFIYV